MVSALGLASGGIVACLVTVLLTWYLAKPGAKVFILDTPNERSLHRVPVPRTGGIALVLGLLMATFLLVWVQPWAAKFWWLIAALVTIACVSLIDDYRGVRVSTRLLVHFLGACLLCWGGFCLFDAQFPSIVVKLPAGAGTLATLLLVVWMINLYNFMDGMDGFAAGMAVIGFGAFSFLGLRQGMTALGGLSFFAVAAAGGFLCFNFPPAKIFMGDVGASSLGLWAAVLIIWGNKTAAVPLWVGLLIFSPFWVDATWTLCGRALRGEKFWVAHRDHFYQRLVRLGWGHRRTVLSEYVLMLACGISGILAVVVHDRVFQFSLFVLWAVIYLSLGVAVFRLERAQCPKK